MSYPPGSSRSCHEADGRSDRSAGTASGSGILNYGSFPEKWASRHQNITTDNKIIQPPGWQKWSSSFDTLLEDGEGVVLFKAYLDSENCGNLLDFWFACQGFRSKVDPSDRKKILQLIKAIYRTYIRGSVSCGPPQSSSSSQNAQKYVANDSSSSMTHQPIYTQPVRLRSETRRAIAERLSHKSTLDQGVFDEAQNEVGHFLRNTAYLAFLKSDTFVSYIQNLSMGAATQAVIGHAVSAHCHLPLPEQPAHYFDPFMHSCQPIQGCGLLPTVEEDQELTSENLTNQSLLAFTKSSDRWPSGRTMEFTNNPYNQIMQGGLAGRCYCSIPFCSRALPHDYSISASSNLTPQHQATLPFPQSSAAPLTHENLQITRFQRAVFPQRHSLSSCPHCHGPLALSNPADLPNQLDQTIQVKVQKALGPSMHAQHGRRRLMDSVCPKHIPEESARAPPNPYHVSFAPVSAQESEHQSTDENRSYTDSSRSLEAHAVPMRAETQGTSSCRPASHQRAGASFPPLAEPAGEPSCCPGPSETPAPGRSHCRHHQQRRGPRRGAPPAAQPMPQTEQNLAETDPPAFAGLLVQRLQRLLISQAANERIDRLMNEVNLEVEPCRRRPTEPLKQNGTTGAPVPNGDQAGSVEPAASSRGTTKPRAGVDLPSAAVSLLQRPWADRLLAAARVQRDGENAQAILEDHCSRIWATSADRTPTSAGSRGSCHTEARLLEEPGPPSVAPSHQASPPQPLLITTRPASSPNPPLPGQASSHKSSALSHTPTASDETKVAPSVSSTSNPTPIGGVTRATASHPISVGLVVGYYLCDDPVPYRSQWPGQEINLGQFKQLIPKKGPFRFFFKKASDEFDSGVVHQEVSLDEVLLPLWEGKVVARVERIE